MLKRAGCLMVSLGIESADPEMLWRHKAGVTLDQVRETVMQIRTEGLRANVLFMTERRTSDFVLSLGLDDMNTAKFTPFPCAPLWETIREEASKIAGFGCS